MGARQNPTDSSLAPASARPGQQPTAAREAVTEVAATLRAFVHDELPTLNNGVTAGTLSVEAFAETVAEALAPLRSISLSTLSGLRTSEARALIHVLGFVATGGHSDLSFVGGAECDRMSQRGP